MHDCLYFHSGWLEGYCTVLGSFTVSRHMAACVLLLLHRLGHLWPYGMCHMLTVHFVVM